MKLLRRMLLLVLALLLLPPLSLLVALSTEAGSGWVLQQTARLAEPSGLTIRLRHERGTLRERLELSSVEVAGPGFHFSAARVLLHWSPQDLLR